MDNFLISGPRSFIGGSILKKLIRSNNAYVIDNEKSPEYGKIQNVNYIKKASVEGNTNIETKFQKIIHTAQIYSREIKATNENEMFQVNVSLGKSMAQLAIKQNALFYSFSSKFQFMSINSTYANQKKQLDAEIHSMTPLNLKWIRIFLGDTYGPNDNRDKIIAQIFKSIKNGQAIKILNPNKIIRLTFIEDIESNLLQINSPGNYSFLSSNVITIGELISQCEDIAQKKLKVIWENRSELVNQDDEIKMIGDSVMLDGYLQSETSLSVGLLKVWNHIQTN